MKTLKLTVLSLSVMAALGAPSGLADHRGEAEAARRHAKAGGPLNDRDAWLLVTYGCATDTPSAFCERLRYRDKGAYRAERRRVRD
jgi:hypothetical protein